MTAFVEGAHYAVHACMSAHVRARGWLRVSNGTSWAAYAHFGVPRMKCF